MKDSEKTVKNHVHNVCVKLGVERRARAVARWLGTAGAMLALLVAGCGGGEEPREELSKAAAIERVEGICDRMLERVEAVGPEPPIRTGGEGELGRFVAWQERVFEETENGLREIEAVPIPRDGSERYLRAYVRLARGAMDAQRKLVAAVEEENDLAASGLRSRRETSVDLAGQVATRYGLSRCGGSAE
jgi:hypothetical protein